MYFSKIYIQDNFVPNVIEDQFRRKVIGIEVTVKEGESLDEAKQQAESFIKEYIEKNTVYHSPDIFKRYAAASIPEQLPIIRYD